ncbi:MAG: S8 family peptidase [Candidatus Poseidoniaceae archaeon]
MDDLLDIGAQPVIQDAHLLTYNHSSKRFVGFMVGLTVLLVFSSGYLIEVFKDNNPFAIRPTAGALEAQEVYGELIQTNIKGLDGTGVRVCIVDSGIDTTHQDLSGMNLVAWRDFVNNEEQPYDDQGHGTSMAGILVANGWMEGVAPKVELVVAKALSGNGTGDDGVVADAIDWCVEQNVQIISLSLGGAPGLIPFSIFGGRDSSDAADDAIDQGIVVIAAAGNDGGPDDDGDVAHPSSERLVISVGGHTEDGSHWSGSSIGDNNGNLIPLILPRQDPHKKPEVVAPAEGVPVINNDGTWSIVDGTSAATVYVTGAIALLLEAVPSLAANESSGSSATVVQIKQALMDTSKPQPSQDGHDDNYGYGMLQIENLISSFEE